MDGRASKNKGARGEREFAAKLVEHGIDARRHGKQFYEQDGSREHADVDHNLPHIHFEVKRREKLSVTAALRQAKGERPDRMPVVAHRANCEPWKITFLADDILPLLNDLRVRSALAELALQREEGAISDTHLPLSPEIVAEPEDVWEGMGRSIPDNFPIEEFENEGGMIYETD